MFGVTGNKKEISQMLGMTLVMSCERSFENCGIGKILKQHVENNSE